MPTSLSRLCRFSAFLLCSLLLLGIQHPLVAQNTEAISFVNRTNLIQFHNFSGVSVAIADMNGDGKDDIVRFDKGRTLNIQYQDNANRPFIHNGSLTVSNRSQWATAIADIDNDGDNDIIVGGSFDDIKVLKNTNNTGEFTISLLSNSDFFVQGTNFVDIDNDGFVDIFSCNDEGENFKFKNNGQGGFTNTPALINTTTTPQSDNSGNYASIWTDHDNDGDIDLYLSKCRAGVDDASDPRRINLLFENDGSNNFRDVTQGSGLKIGAQTWTTDFGDIDNDGDMDAFVLNHYDDVQLMLNNGNGTYTDITASSGFLPILSKNSGVFGIQSLFRDFNNDGFLDLLFVGSKHYLFYNNGDNTFSSDPNPFDFDQVESAAVGDLNHDGFLDIYAGYADFITSPSTIPDNLFINEGNSNYFLAVQLEGTESNRNAIGARLELYGSWGKQIREVRAGEGYGIMNSFTQHFGLGQSNTASRLVIHWPSGSTQEILNPQPNEFITVKEASACVGQACNDGSACTINDTYDQNCNCVGVFQDTDNDGVCDALDICPGSDDNQDSDNDGIPNGCDDCNQDLIGTACNDADPCTTNDTYDANCNCTGILADSDNDGICDATDTCPNFNNNLIGQPCNDNDACTIGETYDTNCNCSGGLYTDADGDGFCINNDPNDNDPCVPNINSGPCQANNNGCILLDFTSIENDDLGIWIDGGTAARFIRDPQFATTGTTAFYLYDNLGVNSSLFTQPISTQTGSAQLTLTYFAYEMEVGDSFVIEYSVAGAPFEVFKTLTAGVDFNNLDRKTEVFKIEVATDQMVIRIRALFNETTDYVILDDIRLETCEVAATNNCTVGAACSDGDPCTVGETYDLNCNCTGGTFLDTDADGVCDGQDACPNFNNNLIGQPCNDGDVCTSGETWDFNCGCSGGISSDNDNDGVCAALDANDNDPCIPNNSNTNCNTITTEGCKTLSFTGFENNNYGVWIDGGEYARILSGTNFANNGLFSFYIQANAGSQSSLYSRPEDYSEYNRISLSFNLLTLNVEQGDNFVIEVATQNGVYNIYETVTVGRQVRDNTRYDVEIDIVGINFTAQTSVRLRARCDSASDFFIIDDIKLEGCGEITNCIAGTACNDGNPCTIGTTYDSNCNCTGGTIQDSDNDGICDANDTCPNFSNSLIGQPCNDGDACTTGETWDNNCGCSGGTIIDNDNDGYCAAVDSNDNDPCIPDSNAFGCINTNNTDAEDCSVLYFTNFEGGNAGPWLSGGDSARMFSTTGYANSGTYSFLIQAGNGIASSMYTQPLDLRAYDEVKLSFYFYAFSMEGNDEFFLEIGLDGNFSTIRSFRVGVDYNTDDRIIATLQLKEFDFTANTVIRFRNGSNSSSDYVIFDDIEISGCKIDSGTGPSCTPGTPCNDNDLCTVGETYDSNCNCISGSYIDNDNDGYCIGEDPDDTDFCIPDNSNCNTALTCNVVMTEGFENNTTGEWNLGGQYATLLNSATFANTGIYVVHIRGNQGVSSSLFSNPINLSAYQSARLNFNIVPYSMEAGDSFVIDIATDGSNYFTYKRYTEGVDIFNERREDISLLISGLNFTDRTRIRFRADGDNDSDYIMIDDIVLEGCNNQNNILEEGNNLDTRAITSLDTKALHQNVELYPNPAHDNINIDNLTLQEKQSAQLSIYDLHGRIIKQQTINDPSRPIDISEMNGDQLYLFRLTIFSDIGPVEDKSFMIFKR